MEWFLLGAFFAMIGAIGEYLEKKEKDKPYDPGCLPPEIRNDNLNPHGTKENSYTQDDIIYKDGRYYENENSEDWEEFEYEISEDERFK